MIKAIIQTLIKDKLGLFKELTKFKNQGSNKRIILIIQIKNYLVMLNKVITEDTNNNIQITTKYTQMD